MIFEAWLSIAACLIVLALTVVVVRRSPTTLALPLAYMINLLLLHVPGAYAFVISGGQYSGINNSTDAISTGIMITAVSAFCFLIGCSFFVLNNKRLEKYPKWINTNIDSYFITFCLVTGFILSFGVGILREIPTIGAAIYFGSSIWMIAVMIKLADSVKNRNLVKAFIWLCVLLAYPITILVLSGFASYGAMAVIIVGSLAVIQTRSVWRSMLMVVAISYLGISVFVNYFESRNELRSTLWSGAGFEERVGAVRDAFSHLELFSSNNSSHLKALTLRLNQNEFVGVAADRLASGQAEYLHGRTFYEALLSPIPRAIWKGKPVEGGSGQIVREMTGIRLTRKTSWGVGNVMELYINFGLWSLVPGFLLLGWLIGWLDRRASAALATSDPSHALIYFLPGVALIQPIGSLVEVVGGAFAALLAAVGLRLAWLMFQPKTARRYDRQSHSNGLGTR
jgi:hypothetical protein